MKPNRLLLCLCFSPGEEQRLVQVAVDIYVDDIIHRRIDQWSREHSVCGANLLIKRYSSPHPAIQNTQTLRVSQESLLAGWLADKGMMV